MTVQQAAPQARPGASSYRDILSSTAIVGAASLVSIAAGMIRVKAIALLLGPAGVGAFGLYSALVDLATNAGGLGIASSGVRQVAEAEASGNERRIGLTVAMVRRVSLVLGIVSALVLLVAAAPLSWVSMGGTTQKGAVAVLGLAVLLRILAAAYGCVLQGRRRIGLLAKAGVGAAILGTVASIGVVAALGQDGVAFAIVAIAGASALFNFAYSRSSTPPVWAAAPGEARTEVACLVRLGVAFMLTAFLSLGAGYAVRIIVLHALGLEAAGLYQAAWTLGGLYTGVLLQAMGTDFYPRLTAIHRDHAAASKVVNEQARVSLILGGPGIAATLTFAPAAMTTFYSSEFVAASELLRWLCAGMALRIVAWPMGYMIIAAGMRRTFIATEVVATVVQIALAWWLVPTLGLVGAGIAFVGVYVVHTPLVYAIVSRKNGFRIERDNVIFGGLFLLMISALLAAFTWLDPIFATTFGTAVIAASGLHALRALTRLSPGALTRAALRRPGSLLRPGA